MKPEVGIYKRKQESKKQEPRFRQERKHGQESDQEKKSFFFSYFLVFFYLFLDRFLGRPRKWSRKIERKHAFDQEKEIFLFFLLSCFLL